MLLTPIPRDEVDDWDRFTVEQVDDLLTLEKEDRDIDDASITIEGLLDISESMTMEAHVPGATDKFNRLIHATLGRPTPFRVAGYDSIHRPYGNDLTLELEVDVDVGGSAKKIAMTVWNLIKKVVGTVFSVLMKTYSFIRDIIKKKDAISKKLRYITDSLRKYKLKDGNFEIEDKKLVPLLFSSGDSDLSDVTDSVNSLRDFGKNVYDNSRDIIDIQTKMIISGDMPDDRTTQDIANELNKSNFEKGKKLPGNQKVILKKVTETPLGRAFDSVRFKSEAYIPVSLEGERLSAPISIPHPSEKDAASFATSLSDLLPILDRFEVILKPMRNAGSVNKQFNSTEPKGKKASTLQTYYAILSSPFRSYPRIIVREIYRVLTAGIKLLEQLINK